MVKGYRSLSGVLYLALSSGFAGVYSFFFLTHWTEHVKVYINGYKVYLS